MACVLYFTCWKTIPKASLMVLSGFPGWSRWCSTGQLTAPNPSKPSNQFKMVYFLPGESRLERICLKFKFLLHLGRSSQFSLTSWNTSQIKFKTFLSFLDLVSDSTPLLYEKLQLGLLKIIRDQSDMRVSNVSFFFFG